MNWKFVIGYVTGCTAALCVIWIEIEFDTPIILQSIVACVLYYIGKYIADRVKGDNETKVC